MSVIAKIALDWFIEKKLLQHFLNKIKGGATSPLPDQFFFQIYLQPALSKFTGKIYGQSSDFP